MIVTDEDIWFGSEQSYRHLWNMLYMTDLSDAHRLARRDDDDEDFNPVGVQKIGPVAIVSVSGGMLDRSSWLTQFFGIPTYDDIKTRLAELGEDKDTKVVVMNYDTPGGTAKGCKLCARYIRDFNDTVKPVVSFTEGMAASAGYWLYSAGGEHVVDEEGRLGSVGAILTHTEYTEMDRKLGITRKVFRSAPYKALGGPHEKLSEEAEAEINQELMYMHSQFVSGISELMGLEREEVSSSIANGKVFRAKQAIRLGMARSQLSLEDTVAKLLAGTKTSAPDKTLKR